jgi:hypothetical protein
MANTPLDDALKLDVVYYSAPIPLDLSVLTVLGAVFDTVYFPNVYLPKEGFDHRELGREIARLEALPIARNYETSLLKIDQVCAAIDRKLLEWDEENNAGKSKEKCDSIPRILIDETERSRAEL